MIIHKKKFITCLILGLFTLSFSSTHTEEKIVPQCQKGIDLTLEQFEDGTFDTCNIYLNDLNTTDTLWIKYKGLLFGLDFIKSRDTLSLISKKILRIKERKRLKEILSQSSKEKPIVVLDTLRDSDAFPEDFFYNKLPNLILRAIGNCIIIEDNKKLSYVKVTGKMEKGPNYFNIFYFIFSPSGIEIDILKIDHCDVFGSY